jgi:hypothetical protein
VEAIDAEAQHDDAENRQRHHLRPQGIDVRALQEHAADDLHEVAHRIDVGQPLHAFGHVADGEGEAAQHEVRSVVAIMACCCVREMVEMNRPAPRVVKRNTNAANISNRKRPLNGTWKISMAAPVTRIRSQ